MSEVVSDFIKRASLVSVKSAAKTLGLKLPKILDAGMPCPRCGGKDRFAVNPTKGVWNCRNCGGGKNGLGLVAHVRGFDLHDRAELLEASALLLNESIPDDAAGETDEKRAAREARMTAALEAAERDREKEERDQNAFRERAVMKARGIYFNASEAPADGDHDLREYLRRRTGYRMPDAMFSNIRFNPRLTYWSDKQDDRGHQTEIYVGYAMVAPFINLEGQVTGCHQTWIDLRCSPKFRPDLGKDEKGVAYPTKKMRGTKVGSLIPVLGDLAAARWVGAEGIENVAAMAGFEGFREDTFYFAGGDLGNLSGKAEKMIAHPDQVKPDRNGRPRRVMVPGPVPKAGDVDAVAIPGHVDALVLLADGDSDFFFTANAMARAKARATRDGRSIGIWWPPPGADWAGFFAGQRG
ncbi:P4 alpha zinc-binding domain-containing protein [Neorhizobium sp. LMR1-1-1.1]